ncbi:MAG TPA: hypothetical protein VMW10_09625 [Alphaproteobacteria bacterium]|nr:hypothetical protein [Alphaproteobacteria bacterium]
MIIACDPGMSGGFAFLTLSQKTFGITDAEFIPFPAIKKEIDFAGIKRIYDKISAIEIEGSYAAIEKVSAMPGQGVSSMFKFGRAYGIAETILSSSGLMLNQVIPRMWQKEMFEGIPEILKPIKPKQKKASRDTKKMSMLTASRLFPNLHIVKDWQSDALLLGEYIRRRLTNQLIRNINSPANKDLSAEL